MRYPWPGNVRELENLVERLAVLHKTPVIGIDALPETIVQQAVGAVAANAAYLGPFEEAKARFEREYVVGMLNKAAGNMAAAARLAKLDRSQFFRMVKRMRIDPQKNGSPA
jgi:two-component system response regulator GlrR